jgi:hypothetical protein
MEQVMNDERQELMAKELARVKRENKKFLDELKTTLDAEVEKQGVRDKNFSFLLLDKTDPGLGGDLSLRIYGRDGIQVLVERRQQGSFFRQTYGEIIGARVHAWPDLSVSLKMARRNRAFLGDATTIAPGIVRMCSKYISELETQLAKKKATDTVRDAALQKWLVGVIRKVPGLEISQRCRMPEYKGAVHKVLVMKAHGADIMASIHDDGITLNVHVRLEGSADGVRERLTGLVEFLERQDYQQFLEVTDIIEKEQDDADEDDSF